MNQLPSGRIEYVDALRGFTMILVVFSHVIFFSYDAGNSLTTFNSAFITFRMPLFFFVSGFVLYKPTRIWRHSIKNFLLTKAKIQIIPALFFLVVFDLVFNHDIYRSLINPHKYGYWFTFTLFEYFVIYSLTMLLIEKIKNKWVEGIIWTIIVLLTLFFENITPALQNFVPKQVFGLLGTVRLIYFFFFLLGTIIRKNFESFVKITNNGYVIAALLFIFFTEVLFGNKIEAAVFPDGGLLKGLVVKLKFILIGICGVVIVFTFFRKNERSFTQNTRIGKWFQYAGRRTLDIYLLHYFLLPRHLGMVGEFFKNNVNPTLEFLVTVLLAIWIVILCLCISNIIRLSNTLAHYMFGVKIKKEI